MEFIETGSFTKRILRLLTDDEYLELQGKLAADPLVGDLIPGGHGLRKFRWFLRHRGTGKRGGIRLIYHYDSGAKMHLLFVYDKSQTKDLTKDQLRIFGAYMKGE